MARRIRAEEVLEVLREGLRGGAPHLSTDDVCEDLSMRWVLEDERGAPSRQGIYLHLRRLEGEGKVVSRRVGVKGGGQHAVWEIAHRTDEEVANDPRARITLDEVDEVARAVGSEAAMFLLEGAATAAGAATEDKEAHDPGSGEIGPEKGTEG